MALRHTLTLAVMAFSASLAHSATVSIENSSFENSFTGWNDDEPSAISGDSYNGSSSAKITGAGGRVDQTVSLQANTDYVLTAYIKGSGEVGVNLGFSTESSKSTSNDWTKVTLEFNSGTATSAEVFGKYYSATGRFDDFSLVSTSSSDSSAVSIPGKIEAEDYASFYDTTSGNSGKTYTSDNVDVQVTTDSGGGYNVGWTAAGEWLEYPISVSNSGNYQADVRVASKPGGGVFTLSIDGKSVGDSVTVGATGGWQSWTTKTVDLGSLSSGSHTLRVDIQSGSFNLNWLDLDTSGDTGIGNGLDPNKTPWENFDLADWYLSEPSDNNGDGLADSTKGSDFEYYESQYFYTGEDGGMVFKCPIKGYKTSTNTSFSRVELREMLSRGASSDTKNMENNWVYSSAPQSYQNQAGGVDGVLRATVAVNHVTETGAAAEWGRVIIGQIHAPDDEPLRLYYRKNPGNTLGTVYLAHEPERTTGEDEIYEIFYGDSRTSGMKDPENGIALNEKFSYEIRAEGNMLYVTITRLDGSSVTREVNMEKSGYDVDGQYMYFKAGVYNQNKTGNDDDYAQVTFYELTNSHGGYSDK